MSLWAIVPVKSLRRGKSRLASVLTDEERSTLNTDLLIRTLHCLKSIPKIDQVLVISYDPEVLARAREFDAMTVQEGKRTNLNNALRRATVAARAYNATKILVIPADLPYISKEGVEDFIAQEGTPPEIIISSDQRSNGTNALFVNPIGILEYNFGEWSFKKHIEQAERKRIHVKVANKESLTFDLDLPEDLEIYLKACKIN
ncbi:MAG TPA: 2-phospho-L-lactate guanylyltransferase [Anaerolineaceae bacterium]|nr:2-phospho-L-lactate guanylyltransferase [Anaerolineaceae bacterium]